MSAPLGVHDIRLFTCMCCDVHIEIRIPGPGQAAAARSGVILMCMLDAYPLHDADHAWIMSAAFQQKELVRPHLHLRAPPFRPLCTICLFPWLATFFIATGYIILALAAVIGHCCAYTDLILSSYLCSLGSAAVAVSATAWSAILERSIAYRQVISHTL